MDAKAGADGVLDDIAAGGLEAALVIDHPGVEAIAEEVAATRVAAVEALRVDAVQAL